MNRFKLDDLAKKVFTFRLSIQMDLALTSIKNELSEFGLNRVQIIRSIAIYMGMLHPNEILKIINEDNGEEGKKKSTTAEINVAISEIIKKSIHGVSFSHPASKTCKHLSETGIISQGIFYFSRLTKEEKIQAIKDVYLHHGLITLVSR